MYLWDAYLRLRRRAAPGFSGPSPIGWQDIDAFIRRSGLRLAPWEITLIEALDDIFLHPADAVTPAAPEGQAVAGLASAQDGAGIKSILGAVGRRVVVRRNKRG